MKLNEYELKRLKKERMEEIDKWLDNEYGVSYTRLEELHDFVVEQDLKHREEKDKEIERLNNIIIKLERYLEKTIIDGGTRGSMTFWYRQVYDYLQELKGVDKE